MQRHLACYFLPRLCCGRDPAGVWPEARLFPHQCRVYQKVIFRDLEFTIPDYYSLENSNDDLNVYAVSRLGNGAFLDFGYANIKESMEPYESAIKENKADIDALVDEELKRMSTSCLDNIKADNAEYIKSFSMAGYHAQEYKCTCEMDKRKLNVRIVTALDALAGDVYYVMLGEADNMHDKYLSEFDGIIASVKDLGGNNDRKLDLETSPTLNENNSEDSKPTGEANADFKKTMDSYEQFFNEYVDFMKKYTNNTSAANALEMLTDYSDFMKRYAEVMESMNNIDTGSLSPADYAYYMEVTARIYKKLSEITG